MDSLGKRKDDIVTFLSKYGVVCYITSLNLHVTTKLCQENSKL